MLWTWDPTKDRINRRKHGISFETAQLVFRDEDFITDEDPDPEEERWKTIGMAERTVIIVIHTWPQPGEPGRIISARKASPGERRVYERG